MSERMRSTSGLFLSSSCLMVSLILSIIIRIFTDCWNLHGIVVILETEGDVIILLVGEGTLGNLVNVILVGDIILWIKLSSIMMSCVRVWSVLDLEMVSRQYWMLWMRRMLKMTRFWTQMKKIRLKVKCKINEITNLRDRQRVKL